MRLPVYIPKAAYFICFICLSIFFSLTGCPNISSPTHFDETNGNGGSSGDIIIHLGTSQTEFIESALGGELSFSDSQGIFTLYIPENALPKNITVTMTPIYDINGFPYSGGLISGVDLEPKGLRFFKPVTLIFTPHDQNLISNLLDSGADAKLTGFGYRSDGIDFHMYPYLVSDGEIRLSLSRFSGYGMGKATEADRTGRRLNPPSDIIARANQEFAELLNQIAELMINDPEYDDNAIKQITRDFALGELNNEILPMLQEAITDDSIYACAILFYIEWWATLMALGIDEAIFQLLPELQNEVKAMVHSILANAAEKTHQRAVAEKDASQMLRMYGIWDMDRFVSHSYGNDFGLVESIPERMENISRFELTFSSTAGHHGVFEVSVQSGRILLTPDILLLHDFNGTGPVSHISGWYEEHIAFSGSTIFDGGVLNSYIELPPYPGSPCEDIESTADTIINFSPGFLMETFTVQEYPGGDIITVGPAPLWSMAFNTVNADLISNPDIGAFTIENWNMRFGEDPYAVKELSGVVNDYHALASFKLYYTPVEWSSP